jgi:hypothetical protein
MLSLYVKDAAIALCGTSNTICPDTFSPGFVFDTGVSALSPRNELSTIPKRFFVHNESLDFILATKEHTESLQRLLRRLIKEELKQSDDLESTIFGRKKHDFFRTRIEFGNFNDDFEDLTEVK